VNIPNNAFFRKKIFKPFRITLGGVFVLFGAFGFLPIVGFWMIPAGLAILSIDVPWAQRVWNKGEATYGRVLTRLAERYPKIPWSKLPGAPRQEETQPES
jgi:hypothetical protein